MNIKQFYLLYNKNWRVFINKLRLNKEKRDLSKDQIESYKEKINLKKELKIQWIEFKNKMKKMKTKKRKKMIIQLHSLKFQNKIFF